MIQLFQRAPGVASAIAAPPASLFAADEKLWTAWGSPIPCALKQIEVRGRIVPQGLMIAVRVQKKMDFDLGLAVTLHVNGESAPLHLFSSFGDGRFPAQFAALGTVWVMQLPVGNRITRCKVDAVVIP